MRKKINKNSIIFSNILYCSYSINLLSNLILIDEFKNLLIVSKEINNTLLEFIKKLKFYGNNNELINFSKFEYLVNLDLRFFIFSKEFKNNNLKIKNMKTGKESLMDYDLIKKDILKLINNEKK